MVFRGSLNHLCFTYKGGKTISYMGLDQGKFEEMMMGECGNSPVASTSPMKYQAEPLAESE